MRYAQLVMGPAGCGKSTYCSTIAKHAEVSKRQIQVINLDPAAEHFDYDIMADIRELIHLDDAMEDEELHFGPNGGLVFCMEYLLQNMEWLWEQLGEAEDDYILFDCPGQIELYTHLGIMREFVTRLQQWNFRVCGVFLLDAQFMIEPAKFFSGTLAALSSMVNLELPHVNILSKVDLLDKKARKSLDRYLDPDIHLVLDEDPSTSQWNTKYKQLSETIANVVDDYSLVKFVPLDISDEVCIGSVVMMVDNAIQFGEDVDVRTKDFDDKDPEDGED